MPTVRPFLTVPLIVLTMASATDAGQQHIVAPDQLAATVADHVAARDASRAAVHEALARPEVQAIASSMGVDAARAAATVDTMDGAELQRAAEAARQVNEQLVGGASTIVISTTTLIIILLLIIILILAIK